jgi:endonuclease YncB( thermonuclease family)
VFCDIQARCTLSPVSVTGPDELRFEKYSVRLSGIDTALLNDQQERNAKISLMGLTQGKIVNCDIHKYETGSRDSFFDRCQTDDVDLAAEIVRGGYALNCRYTGGGYLLLEPPGARNRLPQSPYC